MFRLRYDRLYPPVQPEQTFSTLMQTNTPIITGADHSSEPASINTCNF